MRPKKIILPCPECDAQIEIKSDLTVLQQQAVKALASGQHNSQRDIAKSVGMNEQHLSALVNNYPNFTVALVKAKNQHLDKTRLRAAKLAELDARSLDRLLDETRDLPNVELAGNIAKLVSDLRLADAKLRAQLGDDVDTDRPATASSDPLWCDQIERAYILGCELRDVEQASEIPGRIEGDAVRAGVLL